MSKCIYLLIVCSILSSLVGCASKEKNIDQMGTSDISRVTAANANIALGLNYLKKQNIPKAKELFTEAINDAPGHPPSWYSMGYFLETVGDIVEADKFYQKAIALAPNDGEPHNNYGTFLCRHKKYQRAIQQFVTAAKERSYLTVGAAYENAGLCSLAAGKKAEGKDYFKKAITNDPNRELAYFELAKLNFDENKKDKAYQFYLQYAKYAHKPIAKFYQDMSTSQVAAHSTAQRPHLANVHLKKVDKLLWAYKPKAKLKLTPVEELKPENKKVANLLLLPTPR